MGQKADRNNWDESSNAPTDRADGAGTGELVDIIVTFGEGTAGGGGVGRWTITYSTLRADRIEAGLRQPPIFGMRPLELIGAFWIRRVSFRG